MNRILMMAAAVAVSFCAGAQETVEQVVVEEPTGSAEILHSNFKTNWFISAGAGPQVFMGDHDRQRKFSERISPALDIAVGKWITPGIGIRLMYSGLYAKGATQDVGDHNGPFSNGKPISGRPWHGYWLTESKFDFMNLHADVMFDLCNLIGGYSPTRVYGIALYAGVGYAHTWNTPHNDAISGNLGIFHMFHVGKGFDINLDMRAVGLQDRFDGQDGNRTFDALFSLTAGVSYTFPPRGWKKEREIITVYDNDAVNRLRAEVQELVAKNEKLERDASGGKTVNRKVVEYVGGDYIIYFPINVSDLSKADRAQLDLCSKAIKEAPKDTKFLIMGYADKATGTPEVNEILSRARAESVRACLVKEFGISPERFIVRWRGGVGNMFYDDPALSRVVIISTADGKVY